jgi:FtsP/CotA-like multicopper oxidase with cupredoxin domain
MRSITLFLAFAACTAETEDTGVSPIETEPFPEVVPTGVVQEYTLRVSPGDWTVQREDGETLAEVSGYHINGNFIGPTLICDLGDTLEITLVNQTDVTINLQPHGLFADQATTRTEAEPGETVVLEWAATEGAGTFFYASNHLDEAYFDDQALSGMLGLIVVKAEKEEDLYQPNRMLNYIMLDLYEPAIEFNWDILNPEDEVHNFTLVPQIVAMENQETNTQEGMSVIVDTGDIARVNVLTYGEAVHVLQIGGHTWKDRATRQTTDTWSGAPATSDHFFVQLDNPGTWRVGSAVDDRRMYMTSWLLVQ